MNSGGLDSYHTDEPTLYYMVMKMIMDSFDCYFYHLGTIRMMHNFLHLNLELILASKNYAFKIKVEQLQLEVL
jgi:hypothetical protein